MYSYEDRIRAVELYIKLGKRTSPTIRQLGYPTKNSLKGWYREYQQRQDLPKGYAGREPKFSQPQKAAALEHYLTHDRCIAATMRLRLQIHLQRCIQEVYRAQSRGPSGQPDRGQATEFLGWTSH